MKSYSQPLIFFLFLIFSLCLGPLLPLEIKSYFYAYSLVIKDVLICVLPIIIFCLIFTSISSLGSKALKYVLLILPLVCISNFFNTLISYGCADIIVNFNILNTVEIPTNNTNTLTPAFELNITSILSNNIALIGGLISGLIIGIFTPKYVDKLCTFFNKITNLFFKCLIPILPIFIAGTALKLQHDGILTNICKSYLPILLIFIACSYCYVLLQFLVLSKFNIKRTYTYIGNLMPAAITAFGSMSSAAALPCSITAAKKNLDKQENANIIVPSIVNIHLVGDCFFIPIMALCVLTSFGMPFPSFAHYVIFAVHFVLAKFSVAAVPGGGVFVMFPVMQQYLNMSSDMLAIVTTLYVLFDPIITVCNVCGNGSLAIIFDKLTKIFKN